MSDWVTIGITAINTLASVAVCIFTAMTVRIANKQMKFIVSQQDQFDRPIVTISFDFIRSGLMCFVIENVGTQAAYDVRVKLQKDFIDNLPEGGGKDHLIMMVNSSMYLASRQKLFMYFCESGKFTEASKVKAVFQVTYNAKYSDEIIIDIAQYAWILLYESPEADIAQHLRKIKEEQRKFDEKLISTISKMTGVIVDAIKPSDKQLINRRYSENDEEN